MKCYGTMCIQFVKCNWHHCTCGGARVVPGIKLRLFCKPVEKAYLSSLSHLEEHSLGLTPLLGLCQHQGVDCWTGGEWHVKFLSCNKNLVKSLKLSFYPPDILNKYHTDSFFCFQNCSLSTKPAICSKQLNPGCAITPLGLSFCKSNMPKSNIHKSTWKQVRPRQLG